VRIEQSLDEARATEKAAADQFDQWRDKWSDRRDQISRRLELIDRQLETLVKNEQGRPVLSLVADHGHDDEPLALVP
jgi:hypothetical protein